VRVVLPRASRYGASAEAGPWQDEQGQGRKTLMGRGLHESRLHQAHALIVSKIRPVASVEVSNQQRGMRDVTLCECQ